MHKEVSVLQIRHMDATFGKLRQSTLDLQPGLNLIYAPNESGKSTWCSFIRNMLYGLPTRSRGALAEKNRFAPWDGGSMQGRMDIQAGGQDYTLLRTTRRTASPMGDFSCTYSGTATSVSGVTAANAGEFFLGVPREVFERSAFIGQSGLALDQDAELERRIAALITTGEEDTSYIESYERLKKQLNRRRHNRTGQIPALEREIAHLQGDLDALSAMEAHTAQLQAEQDRMQRELLQLKEEQVLWKQIRQQEQLRRYAQARQAADEAGHRAAALEQAAGTLPDDETLNCLEGQCAALAAGLHSLRQAQQDAKTRKDEADEAQARAAAHPLYPEAPPALRAHLDSITAPAPPSAVPLIIALVLAAAGAALAAALPLIWPGIALSAAGLIAAGLLLCLRRKVHGAQTRAAESRVALQKQIEDYLPLYQALQETTGRARQAAAAADGLTAAYHEQALSLLTQAQRCCPGVETLADVQPTLSQLRGRKAELQRARQAAQNAAVRRDALAEQLPPQADAVSGAPPIPPTRSAEQIETLLSQVQERRQSLQTQLDTLTGQIRALGRPDDLRGRLREDADRLRQLQQEYDAIALAMEVLESANTTLQNRFSPALGARAAEIFSAFTGGRYDRVLLSRDFSLSAEPSGDPSARSIQLLSRGASDQLYLAVRLAICGMVLPQDKQAPLILDDALANFDDERLAAALEWLLDESAHRQILLFTCQRRESAYLSGRAGVTLLTL